MIYGQETDHEKAGVVWLQPAKTHPQPPNEKSCGAGKVRWRSQGHPFRTAGGFDCWKAETRRVGKDNS